MRIHLIWLVVAFLSLSAAQASGQDVTKRFAEAIELFSDDECAEALPIFREVHAASGSPNARLYIARCLQQTGDIPGAYNEMKATVADAIARAEDDPKYAKTRDAAAAELAVLEPLVARIVVAVADPPPGVVAEANGREVPIGEVTGVSPGTVSVVVRAPGKRDVTREVDIGAGETRTVALTLADAGADTSEDDGEDADASSDGAGIGAVRAVGIGVAALGVVGVVVFAVAGSQAKSEFDELVDLCNDTTCPASEAERVEDGRTLTTVANVSLGVGAVALVVGTAMIIFGGETAEDDEADPSETGYVEVTPLVGPGFVGLTGRF